MNYIRICTAQHCGGLKECLETERSISKEVFEKLVSSGIYQFYAYDERIYADSYIICDLVSNLGLPTWINCYKEKNL